MDGRREGGREGLCYFALSDSLLLGRFDLYFIEDTFVGM